MTIPQTKQIINLLKNKGVVFVEGLSDLEVIDIEKKFRIKFPPDLKRFLQMQLPISDHFINWRQGLHDKEVEKNILDRLDWPLEGILWDIKNGAWISLWGNKPKNSEDQIAVAKSYSGNVSPTHNQNPNCVSGNAMKAYIYITASLLLYPIVGRIVVRQTNSFPKTRKRIVWTLCIVSTLVILGLATHIITISQNLNWFLVTSIYLTISVLLWSIESETKSIIKNSGTILRFVTLGIGCLAATIGFFFVLLASFDLDTDQRKWLTDDLIYKERNIGQGPDPSVRLKKVEVYRKIDLLPILAYRIKAKTYDEWNLPLKQNLDVSFSDKDQTLYLTSVVNGYKVFNFADTINLTDKHYR